MRTTATLSSPEAWRAGHQASLPWTDRTVLVCIVLVALAVPVGLVGQGLGWGLGLLAAAAGALLVGAVAGGVAAHRAARAVRDRR